MIGSRKDIRDLPRHFVSSAKIGKGNKIMICYTLFSGSSGNCIFIREKDTAILIDAGQSMKRISAELEKIDEDINDIKAIWLTHEHSDHTKGVGMIAKHLGIPIYCQEEVAKAVYFYALDKNLPEAKDIAKCIRTINTDSVYETGEIMITPFKTPHDSDNSAGYIIGENELGIATDLGFVSEEVKNNLLPCKNVIIESNYDEEMLKNCSYPPYLKERILASTGHLNNKDCAAFAPELLERGCESITLFHISKDSNTHEIAYSETSLALENRGAKAGKDIRLSCALRGGAMKIL